MKVISIADILRWIQQANPKQTWAMRLGCALLLILLMYGLVLAPYLRHLVSLKRELGAHQGLLNNKVLRTKTIHALAGAQQEYSHLLEGLNAHFFQKVEADLLVKTLPAMIEQFHNTVMVLKPASRSEVLTRSGYIKKYVLSLNLSTQERLLDFLSKNEADIDHDQDLERYYTTASRMMPEPKREELHTLFTKPVGDRLESMKMSRIEVQLVMQGDYTGFVQFLDWIYANPKRMDISQLKIHTLETGGGIESSFVLGLYTMEAL